MGKLLLGAILSDGEEGCSPGENGDILFENCSYAIEYMDGMFIATGLNRVSDGFVMTSADGLVWDEQMHRWGKDIVPLGDKLIGVVSHNGVYDESRLALLAPDDVKMNGEIKISFGQVVEDISSDSMVEPLLQAIEPEMDIDTK